MKKRVRNEWIAFLALLVALLTFSSLAASLLMPARTDFGATWRSYLKEEANSIDVLFFGSSIAYCDIIPAVIWEQSGVSSYVMAGPEQTIPISYFYVKETLRTQTPKVVALEVTGAFFQQYEHYTKINIGYMPWGKNRLEATRYAAEDSEKAGLLFPLLNYHSRWSELTREEFQDWCAGGQLDPMAGYTFLSDSMAVSPNFRDVSAPQETYAENLAYLQKMAALCNSQGIELLLFLAPTCSPLPEAQASVLAEDLQAIEGVTFWDWTNEAEALALNLEQDFYDPLHFNVRGAEKFSSFLAEVLTEEFGLHASKQVTPDVWDKRVEQYHMRRDGFA